MRVKKRNINVIIRIRPEMPFESSRSASFRVQSSAKDVIIKQIEKRVSINPIYKKFNFDGVFDELSSQEHIFEKTVTPIIREVLKGFNCTIFAYGQTGTGKTYTIEGDLGGNNPIPNGSEELSKNAGIIPRAVRSMFRHMRELKQEFSIRVSFLELYNEELIDLLANVERPLKIFEDTNNAISVRHLEQIIVKNEEDVLKVLRKGVQKRHVAETEINRHSSRSHCVFSLTIHMKEPNTEGEDIVKVGTLNLVDLAGSECIGRSGAVNNRAKEAGKINTSLLSLGRVVTSLVDRLPYIPYRDSKLTRLLQESLGGRTKTVIIATISPFSDEETLSTLEYANRAKNVLNKPQINQKLTHGKYLKEITQKLLDLQNENECLRKEHGIYLPEEKYNRIVCENRNLSEKVSRFKTAFTLKLKEIDNLNETLTRKRAEITKLNNEKQLEKNKSEKLIKKLEQKELSLAQEKRNCREKNCIIEEYRKNEQRLIASANNLKKFSGNVIKESFNLWNKIETRDRIAKENKRNFELLRSNISISLNSIDRRGEKFIDKNRSSHSDLKNIFKELESFAITTEKKMAGNIKNLEENKSANQKETRHAMDKLKENCEKKVEEYSLKSSLFHKKKENDIEAVNAIGGEIQSFGKDFDLILSEIKELMKMSLENTVAQQNRIGERYKNEGVVYKDVAASLGIYFTKTRKVFDILTEKIEDFINKAKLEEEAFTERVQKRISKIMEEEKEKKLTTVWNGISKGLGDEVISARKQSEESKKRIEDDLKGHSTASKQHAQSEIEELEQSLRVQNQLIDKTKGDGKALISSLKAIQNKSEGLADTFKTDWHSEKKLVKEIKENIKSEWKEFNYKMRSINSEQKVIFDMKKQISSRPFSNKAISLCDKGQNAANKISGEDEKMVAVVLSETEKTRKRLNEEKFLNREVKGDTPKRRKTLSVATELFKTDENGVLKELNNNRRYSNAGDLNATKDGAD